MEFSRETIAECARTIIEHIYNITNYPPSVCLCTDVILSAISAISGYKIIQVEVPVASGKLRGQLLPFVNGERFKTYIRSRGLESRISLENITDEDPVALIMLSDANTNNPCWSRFTLVKEAAHLILEKDSLSSYPDVTKLALSLTSQKFDSKDDMAEYLFREQAAEHLAVEILLSESRVKSWMEQQIQVKNKTIYEIAKLLRIPQRFVEQKINMWGIRTKPPISKC